MDQIFSEVDGKIPVTLKQTTKNKLVYKATGPLGASIKITLPKSRVSERKYQLKVTIE